MATDSKSNPVTLRDIAEKVGVSHVTVSLALRHSLRIPLRRRQEIHKVAEELGYRPNPMAAALAHHRSSSRKIPIQAALGWLNFWAKPKELRSYSEFDSYWRGAEMAADSLGFRLEEFRCNPQDCSPERLQEILINRGISGLLLPPQRLTGALPDLAWDKFTVVRFGRSISRPRFHLVAADQAEDTMLAYQKARDLGYSRIGFVSGQSFRRGVYFLGGYRMAQEFVPTEERLPVCVLQEANPGMDLVSLEKYQKKNQPDAILTDFMDTSEMLRKIGYRVPGDIGLAAMSVLDGRCDTGINQNSEEIGRVAAFFLISLMRQGVKGVPQYFRQQLIEGYWVQGSMLPPKKIS
jgi:DNA-binding LacI/PurR family transcriptional regulator